MSDGAKMTLERSYSDLSDSATTFDPEEQFDRDIDERMKRMTTYDDQIAELIAEAAALPLEARIKIAKAIADGTYCFGGLGCLGKINEIIGEYTRG